MVGSQPASVSGGSCKLFRASLQALGARRSPAQPLGCTPERRRLQRFPPIASLNSHPESRPPLGPTFSPEILWPPCAFRTLAAASSLPRKDELPRRDRMLPTCFTCLSYSTKHAGPQSAASSLLEREGHDSRGKSASWRVSQLNSAR